MQVGEQADAPSLQLRPAETVACLLCGLEVPRGTKQCPKCRRFVTGNPASVTLTAIAKNLPRDFVLLANDVDRFVAGCLVDEGDAGDVPSRRRSLLEYRARLHRRNVLLDAALERRGLFDGRGQLRALWLSRLEGLVNTAARLDAQLGLARGAKRIPTLDEYVERRYGAPAARPCRNDAELAETGERPPAGGEGPFPEPEA